MRILASVGNLLENCGQKPLLLLSCVAWRPRSDCPCSQSSESPATTILGSGKYPGLRLLKHVWKPQQPLGDHIGSVSCYVARLQCVSAYRKHNSCDQETCTFGGSFVLLGKHCILKDLFGSAQPEPSPIRPSIGLVGGSHLSFLHQRPFDGSDPKTDRR